jgi:endonuclease-3
MKRLPQNGSFGAASERKEKMRAVLARLKRLFPKAGIMLRYHNNWELLVAVILSAQCTDKKVNEVTEKLFRKYPTLDDYVRARPKAFERDIYSTGFYRAKTRNILRAAALVKQKFRGELPKTMREMLAIPGVARKTANVVLGNAYGVVEGIAVDTHVRRIARQLGLTDHDDPVKIERDLMAKLSLYRIRANLLSSAAAQTRSVSSERVLRLTHYARPLGAARLRASTSLALSGR